MHAEKEKQEMRPCLPPPTSVLCYVVFAFFLFYVFFLIKLLNFLLLVEVVGAGTG